AADTPRRADSTLVFNKPPRATSLAPRAPPSSRIILRGPYLTPRLPRPQLPPAPTRTPPRPEGVIRGETEPRGRTPPPPPKAAAKAPPALKKRIEQACGRTARELAIAEDAPQSLSIRFAVRSQADAQKVTQQILQIPELVPYQVSFEVRVAQ